MIFSRSIFRWLLFALCVAIFVAAMAWVTHRMIGMDRQREASERDAQVQEKMRLALWRMDSLVSTLLIRENSRPPGHYAPFHSPEDLFSNRSQRELPKGEAVMPSPLLGEAPEFVNLHFQLEPAQSPMSCTSPQVPTGKDLSLASNWYAISPQLEQARQRLDRLNAILGRHPGAFVAGHEAKQTAMPATAPPPVKAATAMNAEQQKMDDAQQVANVQELQQRALVTSNTFNGGRTSNVLELTKKKVADATSSLKRVRSPEPSPPKALPPPASMPASTRATSSAAPEPAVTTKSAPATRGVKAPAAPAKPTMDSESRARAAKIIDQAWKKSQAPADEENKTAVGKSMNIETLAPAPTPVVPAPAAAATEVALMQKDTPVREVVPQGALPGAALFSDSNGRAAIGNAPVVFTPATPEDLKPRWLEDQLLLLRTVKLDGQPRVQGLWLDWPGLRTKLLETIKDLFPHAELSATDPSWLDATSMVTLPVRLLPGKVQLGMVEPSPLRRSLLIAWACFFIAATAVGVVLNRAMVLSERRGAFVSAVTHELRTPLTTFQLYSEMLADDMVPDPVKRREYLRTLCDESTRLTHLVENVLSYSRIERGRASARREDLLLSDLMARIEPRLRQRTQPTGLDLLVSVAPEAAETRVNVDALAVEQIVFNLVDNACKYAAPASKEKCLRVEVTVEPRQAVVRVRDHGPGLTRQQLKRLFRPFEKSATEAAHSAPGVGLGLALCRRLARELGGDLALESSDAGACFKLTVPRSA